ncbi:MAG TPA: hypothetical protein VNM49_05610 [Paenibacillus cookii]|nr:hypothetical protein [Paenibacillus cookii]
MRMENGLKSNFGKYAVPKALQVLAEIDQGLQAKGGNLDEGLSFYLVHEENFRYFNTPCDVVVFGNTGADGIHYGLLTDFGTAATLDEAPVVCVSPMSFDRPVRIVAENLEHFLSLNMNDSGLFYNHFRSEEDYARFLGEQDDDSPYRPSEEEEERAEHIRQQVRDRLHLPQIDHPYRYVRELQAKRDRDAWIRVRGGLHVLRPPGRYAPFSGERFHVDPEGRFETEEIFRFLDDAEPPAVMALVRDLQLHALNGMTDLQHRLGHVLAGIGLHDEAERLRISMD